MLHAICLHAASTSQSQNKDITLSLNGGQEITFSKPIWRQSGTLSNVAQDVSGAQDIPINFDKDVVQFLKKILEKTAQNPREAFNNNRIRSLIRSCILRNCTKDFLYQVIDLADYLEVKGNVAYALAICAFNRGLVNKDDFAPNAPFIVNEKLINKSKMLINATHLFAEGKGCYADRYQVTWLDPRLGYILDMCESYFFKHRNDQGRQSTSALKNYSTSVYDYKKQEKPRKNAMFYDIAYLKFSLNLSNHALSSLTGMTLVEKFNQVTHANMSNNYLRNESLELLDDVLTRSDNQLRHLILDNNDLKSAEHIPRALQYVSVKGNYLSPNHIQELFDTCAGRVEAGGQRSFSYKAYRVVQFILNVSAISAFLYTGAKLIK